MNVIGCISGEALAIDSFLHWILNDNQLSKDLLLCFKSSCSDRNSSKQLINITVARITGANSRESLVKNHANLC